MTTSPIIIIGAGRSGTNVLRDCLTQFEGWDTWDCDEINLIWRHGNRSVSHDEFSKSNATPAVVKYIQNQFLRFENNTNANVIVEKTCANSLRVPFVHAIFPEARFIHIVRDGRDVALSAKKRWRASLELKYIFKKLKYVPWSDVPYYAIRFLNNRIYQIFSKEKRQAVWGPRFIGLQEWAKDRDLIEVCARQWAECVDSSTNAFKQIPEIQVFHLKYEEFTADPVTHLKKIASWANHEIAEERLEIIAKQVRRSSSQSWKKNEGELTREALDQMAPLLEAYGYETSA